MLGDHAFLRNWFLDGNPHYLMTRLSSPLARLRFLNADLLRELFVLRSQAGKHWTETVHRAVESRWGKDLYASVFASEAQGSQGRAAHGDVRGGHTLYHGMLARDAQFARERVQPQAA